MNQERAERILFIACLAWNWQKRITGYTPRIHLTDIANELSLSLLDYSRIKKRAKVHMKNQLYAIKSNHANWIK